MPIVAQAVLAQWGQRLDRQDHQRRWLRTWAALVLLLLWLAGGLLLVRWDRATGGYYRLPIGLATFPLLTGLSALLWLLVGAG